VSNNIIVFKVTGVLPSDIDVPGADDYDWDYWVAYDTALEVVVEQDERRAHLMRKIAGLITGGE
jgi:hypothetical protein